MTVKILSILRVHQRSSMILKICSVTEILISTLKECFNQDQIPTLPNNSDIILTFVNGI